MSGINAIEWSKSELIEALDCLTEDFVLENSTKLQSEIDAVLSNLDKGLYGNIPNLFDLKSSLELLYEFMNDQSGFCRLVKNLKDEIYSGDFD